MYNVQCTCHRICLLCINCIKKSSLQKMLANFYFCHFQSTRKSSDPLFVLLSLFLLSREFSIVRAFQKKIESYGGATIENFREALENCPFQYRRTASLLSRYEPKSKFWTAAAALSFKVTVYLICHRVAIGPKIEKNISHQISSTTRDQAILPHLQSLHIYFGF